jgi:ammonium transporter, Amt family
MVAKTRSNGNQSRIDVSLNRFCRKLFAVNWQEKLSSTWRNCLPIATAILVFWNVAALAEKAPPDAIKMAEELKVNLDTAWVTIAAMLVIFMNAGFCMLETGFCREKNAVNVLAKNLIVFALSSVAFWVIGFGLMFSEGNDFIGTGGFFLAGADNSPAVGDAYKGIFTP